MKVDLVAPSRAIGKSTVECMRSGIVFGTAAMVNGLVARIKEELGAGAFVVATGGLAELVCRHSAPDRPERAAAHPGGPAASSTS